MLNSEVLLKFLHKRRHHWAKRELGWLQEQNWIGLSSLSNVQRAERNWWQRNLFSGDLTGATRWVSLRMCLVQGAAIICNLCFLVFQCPLCLWNMQNPCSMPQCHRSWKARKRSQRGDVAEQESTTDSHGVASSGKLQTVVRRLDNSHLPAVIEFKVISCYRFVSH